MAHLRTYLNPPTLHHNPAFTQAIVVEQASATIYVGGQNAITPTGEIVGDTLREQVTQTLKNLEAALAAADATFADVVQWAIAVVDGQPLQEGFAAFTDYYGPTMTDPPTISMSFVAGLANPRYLVEIDAIAVR